MRITKMKGIGSAIFMVFMVLSFVPVIYADTGSISGTISYSGSQTGTIYVAVFTTPLSCSGPNDVEPYTYVQLSSPGSYTIPNLSDGTYYLASVIITDVLNGNMQLTDPWAIYDGCGNITPVVISGGGAATGKDMTLVDGTEASPNPFYEKYNVYGYSSHDSSGYWIEVNVDDPNHSAATVSVTGPDITGTADLAYDPLWGHWGFTNNPFFVSNPPQPPLIYDVYVTDPSGTIHRQVVIEGYVDVFATNLSPSQGQTVTGNPVFTWTGVAGDYTYEVGVHGDNEAINWHVYGLTSTSVAYGGPPLVPGHTYSWHANVIDSYGNESYKWESFVYQPAAATGSISGTIAYSGSQNNPIYIGVFDSANIGPDSSPLYTGQISSPGSYTIPNIPDGTYYVGAVMTENINAIKQTDPYGIYKIGLLTVPTPVTITGGSAATNIDFTLVDGTAQNPNPFAIAPAKIGVFDGGYWYLDSNMSWAWDGTPTDTLGIFGVGLTGAIPVVGDWTGDGTTKIGVYMNGTWYLDMNRNWQWDGEPTDKMYSFGAGLPDAIPVVGDWNHDGKTKIGIYSDGVWYLDTNGNGQWDGEPTDKIDYFGMGLTGAVPVVGDWNGDGTTKIGIYQNGYWYLDLNGNGQWDGAPDDQLGVFGVGLTSAAPVVGDWNGDGIDEIGIYQQGLWYLDKNRSWQWEGEPSDQFGVFGVGLTGAIPVPGKW